MKDTLTDKEKEFAASLREMCLAIVEQCAQVVEEIPSSASLYENSNVARAVTDFKMRAVREIRSLTDPA